MLNEPGIWAGSKCREPLGTPGRNRGKLTEKIDLPVDAKKDIVQRLMTAGKCLAQGNTEPARG